MSVLHEVTHHWQPTNHTCGQAALAMLLSHHGDTRTPQDIADAVPVQVRPTGEPWGTITQDLATWCITQGFGVSMTSACFEILDLSWVGLPSSDLQTALHEVSDARNIPALGPEWSGRYVQSYIEFLDAGGELNVVPRMSTELLLDEITQGPLMACVNFNVMYGYGRYELTGLHDSKLDPVNGQLTNHFVVLHGVTPSGDFVVADPFRKPGRHEVSPEALVVAMTAAQMECDNLFFRLTPGATA